MSAEELLTCDRLLIWASLQLSPFLHSVGDCNGLPQNFDGLMALAWAWRQPLSESRARHICRG